MPIPCPHSQLGGAAGPQAYFHTTPRNTHSSKRRQTQQKVREPTGALRPRSWAQYPQSCVSCHRGHFWRLPKGPVLLGSPGSGLGLGSPSLSLHLLSKPGGSLVAASKRLWLSCSSPSKDVTWAFTEALSSLSLFMKKKEHFLSAVVLPAACPLHTQVPGGSLGNTVTGLLSAALSGPPHLTSTSGKHLPLIQATEAVESPSVSTPSQAFLIPADGAKGRAGTWEPLHL